MRVADFVLAALRDQGVSHCFMDPGGLNDNFMPPMTATAGLRTIVAAFEGGGPRVMAELPDPTDTLNGADREMFDHMASARAHADGRAQLGEVYVRMFNNPALAAKVGALGEHLRFHGVLPDAVRELVILRYAARQGFGYEWSHHQRPASLAGISQEVIDGLTAGDAPTRLPAASRAVLEAVDAVVAKRSIPADVQQRIVDAHGTAGVVEVVALCGLYAIMGYMVAAFDIEIEQGLPAPPF